MEAGESEDPQEKPAEFPTWFLEGGRAALSLPGLILISAFVGFAGFAKDAGLSLAETLLITCAVWALPGQVVLVGAIASGSSLPAAAFAVTLTSVRLMPMVVALVPEVRTRTTPRIVPYLLSHFVAVTAWVLAMERFPKVPKPARAQFFAGIGTTLISLNMIVVTVVFVIAARMPPAVLAALLFLTPMYFLTSLWGSAREAAGRLAMVFGLVLGPLFHFWLPGFDLVLAGIVGGFAAYFIHLFKRRRAAA